jgi:hypothetical protein
MPSKIHNRIQAAPMPPPLIMLPIATYLPRRICPLVSALPPVGLLARGRTARTPMTKARDHLWVGARCRCPAICRGQPMTPPGVFQRSARAAMSTCLEGAPRPVSDGLPSAAVILQDILS